MVSRGALGNPWIFAEIKNLHSQTKLDEWFKLVKQHIVWQRDAYGDSGAGSICMRKHILWYVSGWPNAKRIREKIGNLKTLTEIQDLLYEYYVELDQQEHQDRFSHNQNLSTTNRFIWDPKYDMDRTSDRGIGADHL